MYIIVLVFQYIYFLYYSLRFPGIFARNTPPKMHLSPPPPLLQTTKTFPEEPSSEIILPTPHRMPEILWSGGGGISMIQTLNIMNLIYPWNSIYFTDNPYDE